MPYKNKSRSRNERQTQRSTSQRGFAAMPREKVQEIAHKGGEARAQALGHEGYVALGKKGGEARAAELGHAGYVELGRKGGQARRATRSKEQRMTSNKKTEKQ